ncbi:MAG: exo-alpha-sialidase [Armatimonadetes bacterium]|nr:exo-alpha-sialidase [Armatimonadota bacterium]
MIGYQCGLSSKNGGLALDLLPRSGRALARITQRSGSTMNAAPFIEKGHLLSELKDRSYLPNLARAGDGLIYYAFVDLKAVWIARTGDAGKSWSRPVRVMECPQEGYIADPHILCDGKRITVYATFVPSPYPPYSRSDTLASASADECRTWFPPRVITEPETGSEGSPSYVQASYPSAAQAEDGTILLAWWETTKNGRSNVGIARFNCAWVEQAHE